MQLDYEANTAHLRASPVSIEDSSVFTPLNCIHGPVSHREVNVTVTDLLHSLLKGRRKEIDQISKSVDSSTESWSLLFSEGNRDRIRQLAVSGGITDMAEEYNTLAISNDGEGRLVRYDYSMYEADYLWSVRLLNWSPIDGVAFPGVIEVTVRERPEAPVLSTALIVSDVRSLRLNQPIPEDRFRIIVPPGVSVYDHSLKIYADPAKPLENLSTLLADSGVRKREARTPTSGNARDSQSSRGSEQPTSPQAAPAKPIFRPENPKADEARWSLRFLLIPAALGVAILAVRWRRKERK